MMTANPALLTLNGLLDRLEEAVDEETSALARRRPLDFEEINRRKSRSLLELTRAIRSLPAQPGGPGESALSARLAGLRTRLEANQDMLRIHLAAAQEIAALLGREMGEAESDGTYSFAQLNRQAAR
ncbi:hypothetical protein [Ancylobacter sp. IITR112]|uniref:hypothetical protein n=1 Tax=Ancylobacter sp. IITR112 TaxID=3138073 RepID=UPI00352A874A